MENKSAFDSFESTLSDAAISYLKESAKWSKFLAILGFIGIALFILLALFFMVGSSQMNPYAGLGVPGALISLVYILIAALYFMPVYYLYNYATKVSQALNERNSKMLTDGLENLKSHHKFLGIAAIVVISIYLLIFLVGILGAMSALA